LADLNNPIANFTVPTDPETKAAYGYRITTSSALASQLPVGVTLGSSFELCANFDLVSQDTTGRGTYNAYGGDVTFPVSYPSVAGGQSDSLAHSTGNICFDRTIDLQKYPNKKTFFLVVFIVLCALFYLTE
jgi:hypothetical protein